MKETLLVLLLTRNNNDMIIFGLYKNNKLIRILVDMHNNKMKITEIDKQACIESRRYTA